MNKSFPIAYFRTFRLSILRIITIFLLLAFAYPMATSPVMASSGSTANVTVFASGLYNPRGLSFGPDGYLYVAEGGTGGTMTTSAAQCQQVPTAGPYSGGFTSRISKISPAGVRSTVTDHLPSSQTNPNNGSLVSGVAAVAFIDHTLYGIEAGAGCSHGLDGTDNTVFRVNHDGTTTTIADLSEYIKSHPAANKSLDDFEPDGTWFGMVSVRGVLYATEPNSQILIAIQQNGKISRLADLSTRFVPPDNWQGPTGITYHGNFYIGTLGTFPVRPDTQNIYRISPKGSIQTAASGLTTAMSVAFDKEGNMYILESDTTPGFPGPASAGSGKVVRVNSDGSLTTIASGLVFPTAMIYGPDCALYVSNYGFGVPPVGLGQIVRIDLRGNN